MFLSNRWRWSAAAALPVVLLWSAGAFAAEPTPGSSQGGSPGPSAPAGYKVGTELPQRITVNRKSGNTSLTATVRNDGASGTDGVTMDVVGFKGLRVKSVEGCSAIPSGELPPGANSGFACPVGKLAAGAHRTYRVTADFDLAETGQICLPVTLSGTKTLVWQQGPVHFGTTDSSADAPDTPLLLGTKNVPSGTASSPAASASASPSEAPSAAPSDTPSASTPPSAGGSSAPGPHGSGPGKDVVPSHPAPAASDDPGELARTGAPSELPVAGAVGAALLAAGGTGLWLAARRQGRR
ncbi:hypothetical protein AB0A70_08015 [Streptomyces morookaense]|uniref:hypothetical protein n=1 Tax=Streptomyces morookaense TaxID=1970 RepID=UPI00340B7FCB